MAFIVTVIIITATLRRIIYLRIGLKKGGKFRKKKQKTILTSFDSLILVFNPAHLLENIPVRDATLFNVIFHDLVTLFVCFHTS